jgi:PAS domain S-box-containing protein
MQFTDAEQQKILVAEKQLARIRALVIVFGTLTFFLLDNPFLNKNLVYTLIAIIWPYGAYVLIWKPYEKYPVFLAGWFTYTGDCVFTTLWIYATGGFYSPYHVIYYTSIIAVAFRFGFRTTMFTAGLYAFCYILLIIYMDQLTGNAGLVAVRMGFMFIIGFLSSQITNETLLQTQQKLQMKKLAEEALENHKNLEASQRKSADLNEELILRNDIFKHAEENAQIGSYSLNLHTRKLEFSDNYFRLLGFNPGEFEPTLEKYYDFLFPEERKSAKEEMENFIKNKYFETNIRRMITKDGRLRYFKVTGKIILEGKNELLIGTMQDITGDVLLNDALKAKNQALERTNQELESFNYIASHDLQEPVRKINTFSNLIVEKEKDKLSPATKDYLGRISSSAKRMQGLIEDFLNYSRIDNTTISFEQTDLNVLLEEVKNNFNEVITEKKAIIESDRLPVINGVKFQLMQLFTNLVGNALKYHKLNEPPYIKITSQKVPGSETGFADAEKKKMYWKISIADKGIGFEPQYAERIFEVFQRLHSKDQYAGTGIGLAICKKIVMTHHGFIKGEGTPGVGSVFYVFIPTDL